MNQNSLRIDLFRQSKNIYFFKFRKQFLLKKGNLFRPHTAMDDSQRQRKPKEDVNHRLNSILGMRCNFKLF